MDDHEQIDIERELRAAMAERTAALPSPRIDLRAIRRRTATRRRLVPVIAIALVLAATAPLAIARTGLLHRRSTDSTVGGTMEPARPPTSSGQSPGTTLHTPPKGAQAVPPGSTGGQQRSSGSSAISGGCLRLRAPLTAAELAALSSDAEAVMERARTDLSAALAKLGTSVAQGVNFADDLLDGLLPDVGSAVDQVDCAGRRYLAPAWHKAVLDEVRAAVLSMGLVTGVVMDRTMDGLGAGDMHASIAFLRMTGDRLLMRATLTSGGLVLYQNTMTVTTRLPDCGVTRVDVSNLAVPGIILTDLRRVLDDLSVGMQGVVPGILEPDATLVTP
jgi:hypothetical protein